MELDPFLIRVLPHSFSWAVLLETWFFASIFVTFFLWGKFGLECLSVCMYIPFPFPLRFFLSLSPSE